LVFFENKYHATRAAGLTQRKTFFIFIYLKRSGVWRERSIIPKTFIWFIIFWKGVSCDASGR